MIGEEISINCEIELINHGIKGNLIMDFEFHFFTRWRR